MSLHFEVCWIEDQASEAEVEAVQTQVRNSGFEPAITRIAEADKIKEFAAKQHHDQTFDLILLDLTLGNGLRGDELATQVRVSFPSTPILFYSAVDENQLREKMAQQQVEGVYCVHRQRLPARVGELVAHLSPALNRLASMRGLAARVVAECDEDFRAILEHWAGQGREEQIVERLKTRIDEEAKRGVEQARCMTTLQELLGSHLVTSGMLYSETRERAASSTDDDILRIARSLKKGFIAYVLQRRNALSHALESRAGDGSWSISRTGRDPVTVGDFPRFRKDFLAQLKLVKDLRALVVGEQSD